MNDFKTFKEEVYSIIIKLQKCNYTNECLNEAVKELDVFKELYYLLPDNKYKLLTEAYECLVFEKNQSGIQKSIEKLEQLLKL